MPADAEYKESVTGLTEAEPDLDTAKANFLKAAEEFSPLAIVRKRPFMSVGTAFLAGFGIASIAGSRTAPSALGAVSSVASLAAQIAPLFLNRARSSDG